MWCVPAVILCVAALWCVANVRLDSAREDGGGGRSGGGGGGGEVRLVSLW